MRLVLVSAIFGAFVFWAGPVLAQSLEGSNSTSKMITAACPAPTPLSDNHMTPDFVRGWLKGVGHKVRSIEDFICCLPEGFRKSYVVGHSSIAAQNGIPSSPRIIMFGLSPKNDAFMAISVNGGGHAVLRQSNNVEIAFQVKRESELQFFDLSFEAERRPLMSGKNPESCMACHGMSGKVPAGGPRPIFDPFAAWNRFVGGRQPFCNESEKKYFERAEARAVRAVHENNRFKCLDKSLLVSEDKKTRAVTSPLLFDKLSELDVVLNEINGFRVSKLIRSYRDFHRLKFGLAGLYVCGGSLKDWLPVDVIEKMHSRRAIVREFRGDDWKKNAIERLLTKIAEQKKSKDFMEKSLKTEGESFDRPLRMSDHYFLRCPIDEAQARRTNALTDVIVRSQNVAETNLTTLDLTESDLIARYRAQGLLSGIRGDAGLRLLFESLGEDTGFWTMSATGQGALESLSGSLERVLAEEYSRGTELKDAISEHFVEKPFDLDAMGPNPVPVLGPIIAVRDGYDSCGEYRRQVNFWNAGEGRAPANLKPGSRPSKRAEGKPSVQAREKDGNDKTTKK